MGRLVNQIILGDSLRVLPTLADESFQMIYIDPPFNTGTTRSRRTLATDADAAGDRVGFGGRRYATRLLAESSYRDDFADYLAFLEPRLREGRRVLAPSGTLYFHIDYREAHYCKLLLDEVFGRANFRNEIIWAYDYGARARRRWPAKHDTILVYAKDAARTHFDAAEVDREPYMAPGLVTPEKAARGKLPTDVWWHTIVPTNGREKTGYPTQKPEGIVRRMVVASTRPGDMCLDFFAGSGTLGAVAAQTGRGYVLIDESPEAIAVATRRLAAADGRARSERGGDHADGARSLPGMPPDLRAASTRDDGGSPAARRRRRAATLAGVIEPLRSVTATRYVEALREGGSLPGLVEADDDGMYVTKFRGAGQGERALVAEVVAGEIARALGLPVPELVVVDIAPQLAHAEPDPEIKDLVAASTGPNLGMDFLPGALPFVPGAGDVDPAFAADVLWLDALITNVDRTHRNPNLIVWHGRTWLIDHGAAFFRQHGSRPLSHSAHDPLPTLSDHVLLAAAGPIEEADERNAQRALAAAGSAVAKVPAAWLGVNPASRRGDLAAFLTQRLAAPRTFLEEIRRARG